MGSSSEGNSPINALLKRKDILVSDATREKNRLAKYRAIYTPEAIIISAESMLTRLNDELARKVIIHSKITAVLWSWLTTTPRA